MTMTEIASPPKIDSPALSTGPPPDQWASDTASAVQHQQALAAASDVSTPGPHIPGAYPASPDPAPHVNPMDALTSARQVLPGQDDVKGAVDSVRGYFPEEVQVQSAITKAGQTAKAYIPAGVADYILPTQKEQGATLPSQETEGTQPGEHIEGVGALPGRISEAGVARLPSERVVDLRSAQSQSTATSAAPPPPAADTQLETAPQPPAPSTPPSLPSQEPDGAQPAEHVGGAGALPGPADEAGVARLPDDAPVPAADERDRPAAGRGGPRFGLALAREKGWSSGKAPVRTDYVDAEHEKNDGDAVPQAPSEKVTDDSDAPAVAATAVFVPVPPQTMTFTGVDSAVGQDGAAPQDSTVVPAHDAEAHDEPADGGNADEGGEPRKKGLFGRIKGKLTHSGGK